jgi:hypothetical protein
LCASYHDTVMYEAAAVFHRPPHVLPPETCTFVQYVADNADINVNKLDGNNPWRLVRGGRVGSAHPKPNDIFFFFKFLNLSII